MEIQPDNLNEINEIETKEYIVPKAHVPVLQKSFSIVKNNLSDVLDIPVDGDANAANKWWQQQNSEDQLALREALAALGSPTLMTNIAIMRGNEALIETTMAQSSIMPNDPCFLIGEDESGQNLRVRRLPNTDAMSATILSYLHAWMEPGIADFNFTVQIDDFVTLLGVLDFYRRQYYQSLMEHTPISYQMETENIYKEIEDALTYEDPRWLLPFAAGALPKIPPQDAEKLNYSLYDLGKAGIIEITSDYKTVTLADPSELLANDMTNKLSQIRLITLGFTKDGRPASQTNLLIRGESIVWFVDIGGEEGNTATVAAVDLEKASEILKEVFTPVGQPAAIPAKAAPVKQNVPMCPKCGKPATWIDAYKRWYCYSCQEYLEV